MSTEALIYVIRPDRTALWLPEILATSLGITAGTVLTEAQFNHAEIQGLLTRRRQRK